MNTKLLLFLTCFAAVTLTASAVNADRHGRGGGRGGGHIMSMPARGGATFSRGTSGTFRNWSGRNWSGRNWSGGNWSGDWRHHRFSRNQFVFFGDFGFPFYGYPYYGYGYGYPYGYDYYGGSAYGYGDQGYGYGDQGYGYGDQGYGYGDQGYGYGNQGYGYSDRYRGGSSVMQLQRRLARAGYYHGAIDGIMGSETRRAIRAYERSHNEREYGMNER